MLKVTITSLASDHTPVALCEVSDGDCKQFFFIRFEEMNVRRYTKSTLWYY